VVSRAFFPFRVGRRLLPLLLAAALCAPVLATAERALPAASQASLGDYHHTRWTVEDGAPPAISTMAQTTDGWLWLGTRDGLYRFDGVQFSRYPLPPGLGLNRNLIRYLHSGPYGELYIGRMAEGIAVLWPDGRLQDLPPGPAQGKRIDGLVVDTDGSIWIVGNGIHHLHEGRWQTVGSASEWNVLDIRGFLLDRQGRIWISRDAGVWRLDRRAGRFVQVLQEGGDLLPAPDGRLWLLSEGGGMRLLAEERAVGAGPGAPRSPESLTTGQFAADGALWTLHCPAAPCVLPDAAQRPGAYPMRRPPGAVPEQPVPLSGKNPEMILGDREGNIWISTEGGLDRFRRKRIVPTELGGAGVAYSLVADAGGRVWAAHAETGKLWQLLPERIVPVQPLHPVSVLARDPGGALLMGGKRSIWRDGEHAVQDIALPPGPDGNAIDRRMLGILDDGKLLWTATLEAGLIAWKDGKWHPSKEFGLPRKIYQSALAGPGQMWLATGDGELFHYDAALNATRPPIDIRALGMVATIFPDPELVLSGDNGTGLVRDGRLVMLRAADANALRNVSGLVVTADGDRWLNGAAGLVHVSAADWKRSIGDPSLPLRYEVFDGLDGYPGRAVFENRWRSAWSGDGHTLWLAATGGVVKVDTAHLERNRVPPTPVILSLSTDKSMVHVGAAGQAPVRLGPGADRFRVDFTSPSLRMPERVRFEYMLEGVDSEWQDAGTRRTTAYTSVKPGDYVFRLRAINEDGQRSTADAVLPLSIAPAVWQTTWFKLLGAALLAMLAALAYRYRVRYLTRRVAERMHVRMAERERIARTLHDTFLQTVHSLMLRVDAIATRMPESDGARRELENVLGHASSALGEGREQLHELRSGGEEALEQALNGIVEQLQAAHAGIAIGLRTSGQQRRVDPEVGSEAAAIAREALHNACIHAEADQVRAILDYAADSLVLTVADNGRGIDGEVLRKGAADGRWGLVGMRERAQRVGGQLEIGAGSEGGTVVRLVVPGARAYSSRTTRPG
jgi:signal transduction histidine kinase/ligand-binding sensor domain-containing protein